MSRILHLTITPCQGFIASARRTRDFWAGSFLLSWLSGVAMQAVLDRGGTIVFPKVHDESRNPTDPLLKAIMGEGSRRGPLIGSIPNRFKAVIPEVFDPADSADAVQAAWRWLADVVRDSFLTPEVLSKGCGSEEIWQRQIDGYWEIDWVAGTDPGDRSDGTWLDRRKNWRSHVHEPEPGDHCVQMGDFQELSGWIRARKREKQDEFWEEVRKLIDKYTDRNHETYDSLELRPSERLCGVALVKRLFPLLKREALSEALGFAPADAIGGIEFWPSLAAIAAVPWMRAAWYHNPDACHEFASAARKAEQRIVGGKILTIAERNSRIRWLVNKRNDQAAAPFVQLDGKLFFDFALAADEANAEADLKRADDPREHMTEAVRKRTKARALHERALKPELRRALREFQKALALPRREASPFLVLLRMDGDEIGKLIGADPENTSRALKGFTDQVPEIVGKADGVLIYAGGDDVLAFLPLDRALPTALALREAYLGAFDGRPATISAGLVFAHFGVPFSTIVDESKRLLEDVAKEENGRDSIAVSVLKPSGKTLEWCTVFDELKAENGGTGTRLEILLDTFFGGGGGTERSSERFTSFVHNLKDRYETFFEAIAIGEATIRLETLFLAEWLKGPTQGPAKDEREKMRALLGICQTKRRDGRENRPSVDGALLIKFLADNQVVTEGAE
jgi:CRISPR-associated protein Cmr2